MERTVERGHKVNLARLFSMKNLAKAGLAATVALSSAGCEAAPVIQQGEVIQKTDMPARDWLYLQPIPQTNCTPIGKTTSCTTYFTYIPVPMHDPEAWSIEIQNCNVPGQEAGKCFDREVAVPQGTYNELSVGDQYAVPK